MELYKVIQITKWIVVIAQLTLLLLQFKVTFQQVKKRIFDVKKIKTYMLWIWILAIVNLLLTWIGVCR